MAIGLWILWPPRPGVAASYAVPVRRAGSLPTASFRRRVTPTALAVQLTVPAIRVRKGLSPSSHQLSTTLNRTALNALRAMPGDRDRGSRQAPRLPSHTTGRTGPYPAVRKVEVNAARAGAPLTARSSSPAEPSAARRAQPPATSSAKNRRLSSLCARIRLEHAAHGRP